MGFPAVIHRMPRAAIRARLVLVLSAALILPLAGPSTAAAQGLEDDASAADAQEYRLGVGDVLDVRVVGLPDLDYRTAIDASGRAALPFGEPVPAAGLTLAELRVAIQEAVAGKVLQRQGPSGAAPITVPPEQVAVQVAEYRPVYLVGDVSRPGALTFRPGMTVRQAIADGGGYTLLPLNQRPPLLEAAELVGQIESLELALARERARNDLLRREAELAARDGAAAGWAAAEARAQFEQIEGERAAAIGEGLATSLAHYDALVDLISLQRERLVEQRAQEEQAVQDDRDEVARLQALTDQGLSALPRLVEARRSLTSSAGRLLDTISELGNLERDERNVLHSIDRLRDERRVRLFEELTESELKLGQLDAELAAAMQQIGLVSGLTTELPGLPDDHVAVRVARLAEDGENRFEARLDTALQPGDVVEVTLDRAAIGL